jgi:hypothetical protein
MSKKKKTDLVFNCKKYFFLVLDVSNKMNQNTTKTDVEDGIIKQLKIRNI